MTTITITIPEWLIWFKDMLPVIMAGVVIGFMFGESWAKFQFEDHKDKREGK